MQLPATADGSYPTPEPTTVALWTVGLVGCLWTGRRTARRS